MPFVFKFSKISSAFFILFYVGICFYCITSFCTTSGFDGSGQVEISGVEDVGSSGGEGAEAAATCGPEVLAAVEQAVSGVNLESIMLISQVGSSALQMSKDSAKLAHKGNALVQGSVAAIATKRFLQCSSAISSCEAACTTGDPTCAAGRAAECESTASQCAAKSSSCNDAALQAVLSAAQAAMSIMAAKTIGGDDPPEKEPEKSEKPKFPGALSQGPPSDWQFGEVPVDGDEFTKTGPRVQQFPPGLEPKGNPENTNKKPKEVSEKRPHSPGSVAGPPYGNSSSPSSNRVMSGGIPVSDSGGASLAGALEGEEEGEVEDDIYGDDGSSTSGSFAGSSGNMSSGAKGTAKNASPRSGKIKMVSNKKSGKNKNLKESKRNVFSKAGGTTIFEKMSRVIQSYCSEGGDKCN